jgi:hypothetical protein
MNSNRVVIVGVCWFALWIALGTAAGEVWHAPGTGTISGFFFALVAMIAWPWILPERVNRWMDAGFGADWRA